MAWIGGLAQWQEDRTAYISVAFSWKLKEAKNLALYWKERGYAVMVGGTILGIPQNAKMFTGIAQMGGTVDALVHHNPDATIASRGCPVGCWFCVVPKLEGKRFTFIPDFVPRPILCDNNLSALPVEYQNHIIRRYQETDTPLMDANSGFEPSTFDEDTYHRWKQINKGAWRFAFDEMKEMKDVERMARILKDESGSRKRVYVLIGNEPIASCYERAQKVREWECEPYCQPVLSLNALDRHQYLIRHDWTPELLNGFARYYDRWIWRSGKIGLKDYSIGGRKLFAWVKLS